MSFFKDDWLYAYVDASGDDGFKFDEGSSVCFVVGVFLCSGKEVQHNKKILLDVKKALGMKPSDELKYSTLRRHRRRKLAYELLSGLQGAALVHVTIKTKLKDPQWLNPKTKFLSSLTHAFPVVELSKIISDPGKLRICIDRMKKVEEENVDYLIKELFHQRRPELPLPKPDFRDSKSTKLLQIADYVAGATREFFEVYEGRDKKLPCPLCRPRRPLCSYKRKRKGLEYSANFRRLIPLLKAKYSHLLFGSVIINPVELWKTYKFLECLFPKI